MDGYGTITNLDFMSNKTIAYKHKKTTYLCTHNM